MSADSNSEPLTRLANVLPLDHLSSRIYSRENSVFTRRDQFALEHAAVRLSYNLPLRKSQGELFLAVQNHLKGVFTGETRHPL